MAGIRARQYSLSENAWCSSHCTNCLRTEPQIMEQTSYDQCKSSYRVFNSLRQGNCCSTVASSFLTQYIGDEKAIWKVNEVETLTAWTCRRVLQQPILHKPMQLTFIKEPIPFLPLKMSWRSGLLLLASICDLTFLSHFYCLFYWIKLSNGLRYKALHF